jgi:hypothetical protein
MEVKYRNCHKEKQKSEKDNIPADQTVIYLSSIKTVKLSFSIFNFNISILTEFYIVITLYVDIFFIFIAFLTMKPWFQNQLKVNARVRNIHITLYNKLCVLTAKSTSTSISSNLRS